MQSYDENVELCCDVWFREEPLLWPCIGNIHVELRFREERITSIGVGGLR